MTHGRAAAAAAGLFALALATRAWHATTQNLWLDEVITARIATTPLAVLRAPADPDLIQPTVWLSPLYYALLKGWLALVPGPDDAALRLLSVLVGALTVVVIAAAIAALAGARAGLLAGGLAALSPFHVWYSQEVRPYVVLLLFGTLAVGALHRGLSTGGRGAWLLFVAASLAAAYTHPIGVLVAALAVVDGALEGVWRDPARRRWLVSALAAIGVGLLPAGVGLLARGGNLLGDPRGAGLADLLYVFYAFAAGFSLGPPTAALRTEPLAALRAAAPVIVAVGLLFGMPLAVAVWSTRGRQRARLLAWLLVPLGAPLLLAWLSGNPINARYAILAFPAFVGLLAVGVLHLAARWPVPAAAVAGGLAALMLASLWNLHHDARYAKEDCRGVAALLAARAGPDDVVLVNAGYMQAAVSYYYPGPAPVVPMPRPSLPMDEPVVRAELETALRDREDVWLVLTRTFHGDRDGRLPVLLAERFTEAGRTELAGATVVHFTKGNLTATRHE